MKKKSIALQFKKSKIANLSTIYGGATNACDDPSDSIAPPYSEECNTVKCTGSDSGQLDSIGQGDTDP